MNIIKCKRTNTDERGGCGVAKLENRPKKTRMSYSGGELVGEEFVNRIKMNRVPK